ncbi:MAG TPA: hypothetical protein VIY68_00975 [Steroidobacteraceae bacterium]
MKRFYFDYTTQHRSLYDYCGHGFVSSHSAIDFAQATVEVLRHSLAGGRDGWSIEVRNAQGKKFVAMPIETAEPIAA